MVTRKYDILQPHCLWYLLFPKEWPTHSAVMEKIWCYYWSRRGSWTHNTDCSGPIYSRYWIENAWIAFDTVFLTFLHTRQHNFKSLVHSPASFITCCVSFLLNNMKKTNMKHSLNRILLYLWRETHFVIKTYILFEPTDPNNLFLYILVYKSNAFPVSVDKQYRRSSQHKKYFAFRIFFSLFYIADTMVLSNRRPTPLQKGDHCISQDRKQARTWFKMLVWL